MSSAYVCASCRFQWRIQAQIRRLQLQRKSFSTSTRSAEQKPRPPLGRYSRQPLRNLQSEERISTPRASDLAGLHSRPPRTTSKAVTGGPDSPANLLPEQLLTYLDSNANEAGSKSNSGGQHKPLPAPLFEKLQRYLATESTPDGERKSWEILKEIIGEHGNNADHMVQLGYNSRLKKRFFDSVWTALTRTTVPPRKDHVEVAIRPSQLLALAPSLQIKIGNSWPRIIWLMASNTFKLHTTLGRLGQDTDPSTLSATRDKRDNAIQELMTLWSMGMSVTLRKTLLEGDTPHDTLDWSFLPSTEIFITSLRQQQGNSNEPFAEALKLLIPSVEVEGSKHMTKFDLPSSALVTLDLLRQITPTVVEEDGQHVPSTEIAPFFPWVNLIESILQFAPPRSIPFSLLERVVQERPESQNKPYTKLIADFGLPIPEKRSATTQRSTQQHSNGEGNNPTKSTASSIGAPPSVPMETSVSTKDLAVNEFVNFRIRGLARAGQRHSVEPAERIKEEVIQFLSSNPNTQLPNTLYEHLMLNLLQLRRPQSAIEVWNIFIKSGNKPTAKTYTVMMRGSQFLRDSNGLESFWRKMHQDGIQPDSHAWSVRMFGLIRGGKVDLALKEMNNMSSIWLRAAQAKSIAEISRSKAQKTPLTGPSASELVATYTGDVDGFTRPNVVIMNSLISALASKHAHQIPKVLAWGRAYGIKPDLTSYNVLLHISMRDGNTDESLTIFQRMTAEGMQANSETWTVLLNAIFHGNTMSELTPAQQEDKILHFINSVEPMGGATGIDVKGYALIIDQLIRLHNAAAAQAVLDHMVSKGIEPTVHIYTILMASYFNPPHTTPNEPPPTPNFTAIDALWAHIEAQEHGRGARLDDVFYDRMIEGYAKHHAIAGPQPMQRFLAAMQSTGRRPSWRAVESVARALDERGDVDGLMQLVDRVRRWQREGLRVGAGVHVGARREYGQTSFWEFILATGVLAKEGITSVEQLRTRGFGQNLFVAGGASL